MWAGRKSQAASVLNRMLVLFVICNILYFIAIIWAFSFGSLFLLVIAWLVLLAAFLSIFIVKIYLPLTKLESVISDIVDESAKKGGVQAARKEYDGIEGLVMVMREWHEENQKEAHKNSLNKQSELFALQSQINPHFLYNTLESIRGQAIIDGVESIARMTEALSIFFRYSISMKGHFVTLRDELDNIKHYFIIQQFRFDNRFDLVIKGDEDEECLGYILPKLTLQPIVENAIYHGLEPKLGQGRIVIRIERTHKRLIIKVLDDGVGMDVEKLEKLRKSLNDEYAPIEEEHVRRGTGIALSNVNQRIRLNFGEWYGLHVDSTKGVGTDVEILVPIVTDIERFALGG